MRSVVRLLSLLAVSAALAGCSHYHLGAPGQPLADSIYVAPAVNASFAPQAGALVTDAVRLAFSRDGRIALANEAASGARLQIRLVGYERDVLAPQRTDTALARKFGVRLTAEVTLTGPDGKVLLDRRTVSATRDVFVDSGLQPAEYQTMPLLAEALGAEIAHLVLGQW